MGLFDWLFRRKPDEESAKPTRRRSKQPRPADVRPLGDNSPMVAFSQGNVQVVMDRDAFDYTYGDADGPDPAQRDLDALMPKVTRVCVLEGAMLQGHALDGPVLCDTRDAAAIQELATCLQIVEDPKTFGHCQCLGGPTMELYAGLEHVATIGLQHGQAIRWKQWYHDAQLRAGERLTRWMHTQGVEPSRLAAIYHRGDNFLLAKPETSQRQYDAEQLQREAQEQAQKGKLAEALTLCTRAIELDPDQPAGYALRGQILFHMGRTSEAVTDCSAAIERGFRHAEAYYERAVALDEAGRVDEALADCSMALHLNPEHAGAWNSRGLLRGRLGRFDEALSDFSEAIRLAPKVFLAYVNRAQLHRNRGQLKTALADYDRAVELVRESTTARAIVSDDPTLALTYCQRGDVRHDLFEEDEAEADFAEARRRHPAAAAHYLGDMWLRRNSPDRALESFSELIRLRPQDARSHAGRGTAHEVLGNLEQAADDYSAAIRLQAQGGPGYLLRARVRHRQGRADDALSDLSEHLRLNPGDSMAYLFRSKLYKEQKALTEAFADLVAAHRATPDNPIVCNSLAWMLATCADAQIRDGSRAVELARQACQATDWKEPNCLDTLAAAYAESGAFEEAVRWQTRAIELSTDPEKDSWKANLALFQAGQPCRD